MRGLETGYLLDAGCMEVYQVRPICCCGLRSRCWGGEWSGTLCWWPTDPSDFSNFKEYGSHGDAVAKVYLDACALNCLTDDQRQSRIHTEAEAVEKFLISYGSARLYGWPASFFRMRFAESNREGKNDALRLISLAGELFRPNAVSIERAKTLEALGYGAFDALHLACGEQASVDVLFTTDDRFIRQVERRLGNLTVRVSNPVNWILEMGL